MKLTKEELFRYYGQPGTGPIDSRANCLREDELARAAIGALHRPERDRVADHFAVCSECMEEFRLIRWLQPWSEQVAVKAGDPSFLDGLVDREEIDLLRPAWRRAPAPLFASIRLAYSVAALLLIVVLALGTWVVSLRQQNQRLTALLNQQPADATQSSAAAKRALEETRRKLEETLRRSGQIEGQMAELRRSTEELSRPQLNIPIADLEPQASLRGERKGLLKTIEVPSSSAFFTLVLKVKGQQSYSGYGLEILDQHGKKIWEGSELQKSSYNTFTVALPHPLFPGGQYQIKLYGLAKSQKVPVEDYAIRIEYK